MDVIVFVDLLQSFIEHSLLCGLDTDTMPTVIVRYRSYHQLGQ